MTMVLSHKIAGIVREVSSGRIRFITKQKMWFIEDRLRDPKTSDLKAWSEKSGVTDFFKFICPSHFDVEGY